jgi:hypothetical protein
MEGDWMPHTTTTTTDDAAFPFAAAMARGLCQLDGDGRLTGQDAGLLRRMIAETPRERRLGVAMEPERHFGPFE